MYTCSDHAGPDLATWMKIQMQARGHLRNASWYNLVWVRSRTQIHQQLKHTHEEVLQKSCSTTSIVLTVSMSMSASPRRVLRTQQSPLFVYMCLCCTGVYPKPLRTSSVQESSRTFSCAAASCGTRAMLAHEPIGVHHARGHNVTTHEHHWRHPKPNGDAPHNPAFHEHEVHPNVAK